MVTLTTKSVPFKAKAACAFAPNFYAQERTGRARAASHLPETRTDSIHSSDMDELLPVMGRYYSVDVSILG
jgi:hypothetical protein